MIKEELLLFVEIEDRAVMVFVDRDLRNGVHEKKEAGAPSLEWTGVLYLQKRMFVYLYTR